MRQVSQGMGARVYVHVGSPKTGTTFLQDVLWSQRDLARRQGLLLPAERFFDHFLGTLDVRGLAGRPEHPPRAVGMWQRLVAEAEAHDGPSLISHELFAGASAEQATQALAAFSPDTEVHVVLTARDLVRQITAEWQEHIKHRSTTDLASFTQELRADRAGKSWFWRVQDFAGVLERWGAGLPPDRVHVVTVPPSGADPGLLWDRFASLLGLDPTAFSQDRGPANTSLGVEQAELLRRVNLTLGDRLPLPGPYAPVVKQVLAHRVLAGRPGTRLALDRPTTDFAIERSQTIADRLRAQGVHVVGDLAELVPDAEKARAAAREEYPEPSPEQLLDESVAALAGVLVALNERRVRHDTLLQNLRERPVRFTLLRASERHPALGRARRAFFRARSASRRLKRH